MIELFKRQPWYVKVAAWLVWSALWLLGWRYGPWSRAKE